MPIINNDSIPDPFPLPPNVYTASAKKVHKLNFYPISAVIRIQDWCWFIFPLLDKIV